MKLLRSSIPRGKRWISNLLNLFRLAISEELKSASKMSPFHASIGQRQRLVFREIKGGVGREPSYLNMLACVKESGSICRI